MKFEKYEDFFAWSKLLLKIAFTSQCDNIYIDLYLNKVVHKETNITLQEKNGSSFKIKHLLLLTKYINALRFLYTQTHMHKPVKTEMYLFLKCSFQISCLPIDFKGCILEKEI